MSKNIDDINIEIIYKDDIESRNNIMKYLINLILDNNLILGGLDVSEFGGNTREGDKLHGE